MLSVHDPAFDAYAEDYDSALRKGLSASGESKEFTRCVMSRIPFDRDANYVTPSTQYQVLARKPRRP